VHTEFVTLGRVTIAAIVVHGSFAPNAGPIGFGAGLGEAVAAGDAAGTGDAAGAGCAAAATGAAATRAKAAVNKLITSRTFLAWQL
jgi:hypothetical protein